MTDDPLAELAGILEQERVAIRDLDAPAVLEFARRKESLMTALPNPLPEPDKARLAALVPALRHNGVLLAHARGVLHDALAIVRPDSLGARAAPAGAPPRLLSVRG